MVLYNQFSNTQEHVPEAECDNHILKEHICVNYHGIPYKKLLRTIICYMVMETAAKDKLLSQKRLLLELFQPAGNSTHGQA